MQIVNQPVKEAKVLQILFQFSYLSISFRLRDSNTVPFILLLKFVKWCWEMIIIRSEDFSFLLSFSQQLIIQKKTALDIGSKYLPHSFRDSAQSSSGKCWAFIFIIMLKRRKVILTLTIDLSFYFKCFSKKALNRHLDSKSST